MALLSAANLYFAVCAFIVYVTALYIYRAFFDPLSKFPGPKLAAASLWYEFYYDVVKKGRYTWKIARMHEKYGKCEPVGCLQEPKRALLLTLQQDPSSGSALTRSTSMILSSSTPSTQAQQSELRSTAGLRGSSEFAHLVS